MSISALLPVAVLIAAPAQDQTSVPPPPAATVSTQAAPASPAVPDPAETATATTAVPPEFADPLTDPATMDAAQVQAATAMQADGHTPGDPLEGFNRSMFDLHQELDKALYRPVAMGYKHIVPKPVRSGLRNVLSNLAEPIVFLNYLLQFKIGKAAETLARFTFNSTMGIGGIFDIAKRPAINLPHRDNSFGDTLAYYGVGPGPYLFIPFVGPTTLRDVLGGPIDGAILPVAVGRPYTTWEYQFGGGAISGLDTRAEADPALRSLFSGAVDPYATLRSVWTQNRKAEVSALHHHAGAPAVAPELDDPLTDPASEPAKVDEQP